MGNAGIYSVGTDSVYQKWQFSKTDYFAGISWEGLTRETLVKTSCLYPVLTLRIPIMCRAHASLRRMITRELLAKTFQSSMSWVFTLSLSHTTLTNKSHKIQGNKLKQLQHFLSWNKSNINIVVNHNFTLRIKKRAWWLCTEDAEKRKSFWKILGQKSTLSS